MQRVPRSVAVCLAAFIAWTAPAAARAADLEVLSAGAVQEVIRGLAADFAAASGHTVTLDFAPVGTLQSRLAAGEKADVIILSVSALDTLGKAGGLVDGSRAVLGRTGIGVAVRAGAARPDISNAAALRQALLKASSIVYADPAKGASSGIYVAQMLERLGIARAVAAKTTLRPGGYVVEVVAAGGAELGLHNISEILPVKGVDLVGPLPPGLQHTTTYAAAVAAGSPRAAAAKGFIAALNSPSTAGRWRAAGFEPGETK
jgi:molybdate transport system substrate-binding protein